MNKDMNKIIRARRMIVLAIFLIIIGLIRYWAPLVSCLQKADLVLFNYINRDMYSAMLDRIMQWLTYLGGFWAGWLFIILLILIYVLIIKKPAHQGLRAGLFVSLIYGSVSAVQLIIKHFVNRPRPFEAHEAIVRVVYPTDASFPSGHAATVFMMATVLSYCFPKYKYIFYIFAGLVSFSRVYLGVHYPGDVIAGALIGYVIARLFMRSPLPNLFFRSS
jgi:undecaprenyl-diphosphatase